MNKLIKYISFTFILTFILTLNVKAECSYQERKDLLNAAKEVDIAYEVITETITENGVNTYGEELNFVSETYKIKFSISGLTENLYIKYYNYKDKTEKFINNESLKDGIYTFYDNNYTDLYTYYFEIYTNKPNCMGNSVYTYNIKKPIFNGFSNYKICNEKEMTDYEMCQKFITKKINISESEFIDKAKNYINSTKVEVEENDKIMYFLKKNYYIFLITLLIGVIVVACFVIRKKRSTL